MPHIDGVAVVVLGDSRVAVGVEVQAGEPDCVDRRSIGGDEVALPREVAGVGQHDLVEKADRLTVGLVHQHLGMFVGERITDRVHGCVGVGDGSLLA